MAFDPNMAGAAGDLGAGIGGSLGAIIGQLIAAGDFEEAQRIYDQAAAIYDNIDPNVEIVNLGPTAYERVQGEMDPTTRLRQAQVLDELSRKWEQGGMDATARADLAEGLGAAAQQERASRGAILNDAAARGMGRSGATLAMQMQAQQGAASRANQAGLRAAADAQARAYQALADSGDLATRLRGQDYGEASDRAQARDAIDRFNAQNRQQTLLSNKNMEFQRAQARYGAQQGRGQARERRGQRTVETAYGAGSGLGRAAGMYFGGGR